MSAFNQAFDDPDFVTRYLREGPTAFTPGHGGMLQMAWQLLAERMPADGHVLVVGAGGGLDTRVFAERSPGWRFTGVDPSPQMLSLARDTLGDVAVGQVELIEGSAADAPAGPYDAATLICVLGVIPDDGSKLGLLKAIHDRLSPGAPFVLVDQCIDRTAPDYALRLSRYVQFARASGVSEQALERAEGMMRANANMATAARDEALIAEAGFGEAEVFYRGMAWAGWVAYA